MRKIMFTLKKVSIKEVISLIASSELFHYGYLRLSANHNAKICCMCYCNAPVREYCLSDSI